jgi:dUTP pyrophosphatase
VTLLKVPFLRLPHAGDLEAPAHATAGAAGLDLRAALGEGDVLVLAPGERAAVPTGIALALPAGYEGQVRPRSGLALSHGITCLNAPGTIDSDYRGEITVILVNLGQVPVAIRRGERIAQLVIQACVQPALEEVLELPASGRGVGGFGSSGMT